MTGKTNLDAHLGYLLGLLAPMFNEIFFHHFVLPVEVAHDAMVHHHQDFYALAMSLTFGSS